MQRNSTRLRHFLVTSGVALALAACTADRVDTPATPLEAPIFVAAAGDTVRMTESLRIGVLDGDEAYQFTFVNWILPLPDGGMILDDVGPGYEGAAIRRFGNDGRLIRSIGGMGEGPGEYTPGPLGALLADGSLLISDQSLSRLTRFDTAGRLVQTVIGEGGMVNVIAAADGGWYSAAVTGNPPDKPRHIVYYRYGNDGALIDSIPASDRYHEGPLLSLYEARATTAILPDGRLVSGRTDSMTFSIESSTETTFVARPEGRVRFTEEEKASLLRMLGNAARRRGGLPADFAIPDLKPAYHSMFTDSDGRLLFRRSASAYRIADTTSLQPNQTPWREPVEVDVFDSTGKYRGRLIAPRSVPRGTVAFGDGVLWLVHEGESGEQYAVRWTPDREAW